MLCPGQAVAPDGFKVEIVKVGERKCIAARRYGFNVEIQVKERKCIATTTWAGFANTLNHAKV